METIEKSSLWKIFLECTIIMQLKLCLWGVLMAWGNSYTIFKWKSRKLLLLG